MQLRLTAAMMAFAAIWPMAKWIDRHDDSYPLVETFLIMTVPFYLVPLVNEHRALSNYPESTISKTTFCVLLFQVALLLGQRFPSRTRRKASRSFTDPLLPDDRQQYLSLGLFVNTAWLYVSSFTDLVPPTLVGTLRALFFGIGLVGAFTMTRLWAAGRLSAGLRAWLALNLTLQVGMIIVSLLLIQALVLMAVALLGYFSVARRAPWLLIGAVLAVVTVLHNGKSQMRYEYWEQGRARPTFTELPSFYAEWFETGLSAMNEDEENSALLLFDRASLLQIVAYVVDRVPEKQPNFEGATYAAIPAQVVSRFLSPNKPGPNDSGKLLSVGLGLISARAAETTSIGFGMIAESYANFGLWGAGILGFVLGGVMQYLAIITTSSSTFSVLGLLRILGLAWCLSAEVTLIVWLSSFYQACIAVIVPLLLWSQLSGPQLPRAGPKSEADGEHKEEPVA